MTSGTTRRKSEARQTARILRILEKAGGAAPLRRTADGSVSLSHGGGRVTFGRGMLRGLKSAGLVEEKAGDLRMTAAACAHLRRLLDPETGFAAQHGRWERIGAGSCQGRVPRKNLAESPLDRLYFGRGKAARRWLCEAEYEAGERLRADFERACMRRRITPNWDTVPVNGGCMAAAGEIPDIAIDARRRVEKALDCLQHDLAEIALDICCYLKGLEQVERERCWPPRSAKLMLRTALSGLAAHYGLTGDSRRRGGAIMHWGDGDYRPRIAG